MEYSEPQNVFDIVEFQQDVFNQLVTTKNIHWSKECEFACQALQANEHLNKVAWSAPESLRNAINNVASIGVSLNPALKHAYLVPRKNTVCLDISYMGLLNIAVESGCIEWGQAKIVYKNDEYLNTGIDTKPKHDSKTFGDKGEIVGAYCTVKLPSGDYLTEEMDIAELNKIKAASKSAKGPWMNWANEMMRKAVTKRASKYWPLKNDSRIGTAVNLMNDQDGNFEDIKDITPKTESDTLNQLLEQEEI